MAHILVADDNPLSLQFFGEAIATAGHTCETAGDGLAAVALASARHFDLMLIDARMPNLDGPQTLQAIRSGNGPSRLTTAWATTADSDVRIDALKEAGFVEVLIKPIGLARLRAMFAQCLNDEQSMAISSTNSAVAEPLLLDDARALAAIGGDAAIVAALRGLLSGELDALPGEINAFANAGDLAALRDRLHRLDASAGFCGTPLLASAAQDLRRQLDADSAWPSAAIVTFLDACTLTQRALN